jgi:hypothetical protein
MHEHTGAATVETKGTVDAGAIGIEHCTRVRCMSCLSLAAPSTAPHPTRGVVKCEEAREVMGRAAALVRDVCVLGCGRCGVSAFCEVKL